MARQRCNWCTDSELYLSYHDEEWGVAIFDSQKLFEFLLLEGMQAGLNWLTILKKRENFREAFADFNPEKIAAFTKRDITRLMNNDGIIRNQLKINAAITNAKTYLNIQETGDFSQYIWQFVDGTPLQNHFKKQQQVPTTTEQSDLMSKTLKKAGFKFVGSTICYAFMQATGMVNDHITSCFRHKQLQVIV